MEEQAAVGLVLELDVWHTQFSAQMSLFEFVCLLSMLSTGVKL